MICSIISSLTENFSYRQVWSVIWVDPLTLICHFELNSSGTPVQTYLGWLGQIQSLVYSCWQILELKCHLLRCLENKGWTQWSFCLFNEVELSWAQMGWNWVWERCIRGGVSQIDLIVKSISLRFDFQNLDYSIKVDNLVKITRETLEFGVLFQQRFDEHYTDRISEEFCFSLNWDWLMTMRDQLAFAWLDNCCSWVLKCIWESQVKQILLNTVLLPQKAVMTN